MRSIFIWAITLFFLIACNSSSENKEANEEPVAGEQAEDMQGEPKKDIGKIGQVEAGMSEEEVINIMGEPTSVETLNPDDKAKTEDWFYGDNQKIRIIRGVVNRVTHDIKGENATIRKLLDARNANDTTRTRELMEKLKRNDY